MATNVEATVLRALKGYKINQGMAEAEADAWAASNLVAGVAQFEAVIAQPRYRRGGGAEAALTDLKARSQGPTFDVG